ncbi:unnamed protein product [Citrullus colocynthis]|uniref:Uncharacterized protein n=1 Tax=Citrullus colocynthis TaxID=252529 RepID=A0ABP0Y1V6_9ROSI
MTFAIYLQSLTWGFGCKPTLVAHISDVRSEFQRLRYHQLFLSSGRMASVGIAYWTWACCPSSRCKSG